MKYSLSLGRMVIILFLAAVLAASCKPKSENQPYTGKERPLKVLSKAYKPYMSDVKEGMEGVDLSSLSEPQKELTLKLLNEIPCACGCAKTTVAECRVRVKDCDTGQYQANFILEKVRGGEQEGEVVRDLYKMVLKQRVRGSSDTLLAAINPNYSKEEIVNNIAKLFSIDMGAFKPTGRELQDARQIARIFLRDDSGILNYIEGIPDELYIIHGITYELLPDQLKGMFEFYFFRNRPELQNEVFPYLNPGTSEGDMIIGMSEDLFQEPPPRTGINVTPGNAPSRGPADAPITIYEFCDFQCPYCAKAQPTVEQFWNQYNGKIRHVYKNFPLSFHQNAEPAAKAALAADRQGKFFEYAKLLFENQRSLDPDTFVKLAQQLGMNVEKFKADMASPEIAQQVQKDLQEALAIGVSSTPTFIVNGTEIRGARSICSFVEAAEGNE